MSDGTGAYRAESAATDPTGAGRAAAVTARSRRPAPDECAPYYLGYVERVPDGDVVETLKRELDAAVGALLSVPAERERHRYREGAWSVRQAVGHVIDTERVFQYRAASIARGDAAELPGMDQEAWAIRSPAERLPLAELARELGAVRLSSIYLFRSLPADAWDRRGVASGFEVTVRALAWCIAGHELHHRRLLAERYGVLPES